MLSKDVKYIFSFCPGVDYNFCISGERKSTGAKRLCYVTTQKYRQYLVCCGDSLYYTPYVKREHQWFEVKLKERVSQINTKRMLSSKECLRQYMVSDFFVQFPEAEECFFDSLPTCREVRSALYDNPYGSEIQKKFYIHICHKDDLSVDDADGVVDILCEEGTLSIPFRDCTVKGVEDFKLQMYRSLLHPDSKLVYFNQCFWELLDNLCSKLRIISWSNLRRLIDEIIEERTEI